MTESRPGTESSTQRYASIGLILLAVFSFAIFLLLLKQWQVKGSVETPTASAQAGHPTLLEMSRSLTQTGITGAPPSTKGNSLFLPLVAFSLALGVGACVGRFWPTTNDDDASTSETDVSIAAVSGEYSSTPAIDDAPASALAVPIVTAVHQPNSIDDLPRDEALAAKDEIIASLESIIKENRDRWSQFEMELDKTNDQIRGLQAELQVANDIIEGVHGDVSNVIFEPPQVMSRG